MSIKENDAVIPVDKNKVVVGVKFYQSKENTTTYACIASCGLRNVLCFYNTQEPDPKVLTDATSEGAGEIKRFVSVDSKNKDLWKKINITDMPEDVSQHMVAMMQKF